MNLQVRICHGLIGGEDGGLRERAPKDVDDAWRQARSGKDQSPEFCECFQRVRGSGVNRAIVETELLKGDETNQTLHVGLMMPPPPREIQNPQMREAGQLRQALAA